MGVSSCPARRGDVGLVYMARYLVVYLELGKSAIMNGRYLVYHALTCTDMH